MKEVELLISQGLPLKSTFDGKCLADYPLFVSDDEEKISRVIVGIEHLNMGGWKKIRFFPDLPLESVVVGDNQKTAAFKDFALRIRGPITEFMKKATQSA